MDLRRARALLRTALAQGTLVRIVRAKLAEGHLDGKVVALGTKFLALALVGDDIRLDGLVFMRVKDISEVVSPAPYAAFLTEAVALRGERFPRVLSAEISSWRAIARLCMRRHSLLTLHLEERKPDVAYIGRPGAMSSARCTLICIGPDARWDPDDELVFAWKHVTRMDCGGAYEDALDMVSKARS